VSQLADFQTVPATGWERGLKLLASGLLWLNVIHLFFVALVIRCAIAEWLDPTDPTITARDLHFVALNIAVLAGVYVGVAKLAAWKVRS
jgi:hypothetical protein